MHTDFEKEEDTLPRINSDNLGVDGIPQRIAVVADAVLSVPAVW